MRPIHGRAHFRAARSLAMPVTLAFLAALNLATLIGCGRTSEPEYQASEAIQKLPVPLQQQIAQVLREHCGTPTNPKLLGQPDVDPEHLRLGHQVYAQRCQQCHGISGDGAGPAAAVLRPRPRDYRPGIFKFTSTPYGYKPRRDDLIRTVSRGISGTSMPSFKLLPKQELEAVVDYVLVLTHRGELEKSLAYELESEEELIEGVVPDAIDVIVNRWKTADNSIVYPLTSQPVLTAESVVAGKKAFLSKGCSKCHGNDGRGYTKENIGKDAWGFDTKAADLTSGMLHGGREPLDIYRRIISGINGTPMPGFSNALRDEPETFWDLVAYVPYVSNRRREGVPMRVGDSVEPQPAMNVQTPPK